MTSHRRINRDDWCEDLLSFWYFSCISRYHGCQRYVMFEIKMITYNIFGKIYLFRFIVVVYSKPLTPIHLYLKYIFLHFAVAHFIIHKGK